MSHRWNGNNLFSSSKCYYEEWLKTLATFITPPAEAWTTTLEISIDTYVEVSVKEGKRQQRGVEPGHRTFISDLQQIMPHGDKWLLSNGEYKTNLICLFVNFLKKYEKKLSIIINDDEHTWRIEDWLIVAKDTGLLMLVLFTVVQRVRYQNNGY